MSDFLTVTNANELIRIATESLVYIASEGNYSDIYTLDGEKHTVTLQLGIVEALLDNQLEANRHEFVRIGKRLIVNLRFLHYLNPSKKQIVLSDCHTFKINLEASKEALKNLKDYFEQKMTKQ